MTIERMSVLNQLFDWMFYRELTGSTGCGLVSVVLEGSSDALARTNA
jgi:hypothetical protein